MTCLYTADIMCSDWTILGHSPLMSIGLQKLSKKPHNKLLINLGHSVFMGKSQLPVPCSINLAITQSIQQGLSLRFSTLTMYQIKAKEITSMKGVWIINN